jgi:DNA-binding MarR family transcriptional regulator
MSGFIKIYDGSVMSYGLTNHEKEFILAICLPSYINWQTNQVHKATAKEIAKKLGLANSTAYNLLSSLKKKHVLIEIENKTYLNPLIIYRHNENTRKEMLYELGLEHAIDRDSDKILEGKFIPIFDEKKIQSDAPSQQRYYGISYQEGADQAFIERGY